MTSVVADRKSLADLAYEAIRDKILNGDFEPKAWLRQEELAKQLGVSYTPVRQALDRLVADGLAERVLYKGVRVAAIDEDAIAEVYCLRLLVEPRAARLSAIKASSEQLMSLRSILEDADKRISLHDMPLRRQLNRKFHILIWKSSGSGSLGRLCEVIWNRYPDWMLYEGLHRQPGSLDSRLKREIREHQAIVDALSGRDADAAQEYCANHIKATMKEDLMEVFGVPGHVFETNLRQMGLS